MYVWQTKFKTMRADTFWSFAKVNNRLAEVYFEKRKNGPKILGHCYVTPDEYNTKQEKRWIEEDAQRHQLTYRVGKYKKL